ncbi:hypothetical protein [Corynebacterium glyciniphilum]|uniref:hypothetical protein n=1 Tax=Corynebacterium glyciniphilum TaxID=1404244 RepID=UPI0021B1EF79|nr:hypothetical protein [Corynebacterium glyciniphilum]
MTSSPAIFSPCTRRRRLTARHSTPTRHSNNYPQSRTAPSTTPTPQDAYALNTAGPHSLRWFLDRITPTIEKLD